MDSETNILYLSDQLIKRETFYNELVKILKRNKISYHLLPSTKDIWCRDYMPIQKSDDEFIQFLYKPSYLQTERYRKTITNVDDVCERLKITTLKSDLKIDGGNIIRSNDCVILTDRIFSENKEVPKKQLINELEVIFGSRVIIIPADPDDYLGHADGLVRFYSNDTVMINQYKPNDNPNFQIKLKEILTTSGFRIIEIPYNPYENLDLNSANGFYINFLQMKNFILLPTFNKKEDQMALDWFQKLNPGCVIETIDAQDIAKDGGVLNCITCNLMV